MSGKTPTRASGRPEFTSPRPRPARQSGRWEFGTASWRTLAPHTGRPSRRSASERRCSPWCCWCSRSPRPRLPPRRCAWCTRLLVQREAPAVAFAHVHRAAPGAVGVAVLARCLGAVGEHDDVGPWAHVAPLEHLHPAPARCAADRVHRRGAIEQAALRRHHGQRPGRERALVRLHPARPQRLLQAPRIGFHPALLRHPHAAPPATARCRR